MSPFAPKTARHQLDKILGLVEDLINDWPEKGHRFGRAFEFIQDAQEKLGDASDLISQVEDDDDEVSELSLEGNPDD